MGEGIILSDTMLVTVATSIAMAVGKVSARGRITWKTMDRIGIAFDPPMPSVAYDALVG